MTDTQPTYYTAIAGDAKWDSLDLPFTFDTQFYNNDLFTVSSKNALDCTRFGCIVPRRKV